jgi:hypothetical protein
VNRKLVTASQGEEKEYASGRHRKIHLPSNILIFPENIKYLGSSRACKKLFERHIFLFPKSG